MAAAVLPPPTYSDLCSQANVSCAYSYSVVHRLNSTNTTPFIITRASDSATYNASYTGASYSVDVAAEEAFCLGNGGTTTVTTYYTTYNDCNFTTLYDQNGSGCDLVPPYAANKFPYRISPTDGYPILIAPTEVGNPVTGQTFPWLSYSGAVCSAVSGGVAKTMIVYTNNHYPSPCCGEQGLSEAGSGNPPTFPITIVNGTMFSLNLYNGGAVPPGDTLIAIDWEGNGSGTIETVNTPPIWGVAIFAYSGTVSHGGTNQVNDWWNNVQGDVNATPTISPINTGIRMGIGCSGDVRACGAVAARDLIFTSNDVSATGGLPAAIYTYLTNIYAGL